MDRRDFLSAPPLLAALSWFAEPANAQSVLKADPAAVEFWTKKMGVEADLLPAAGAKRAGAPSERSGLTPEMQEAEMEPFFFYFDDQADDPATPVIAAQDIKSTELDGHDEKGRDVKITFVKRRLRFGDTDRATYEKYQSSGLYLETQQHPEAPSDHYGTMAWSLLSAVLPMVPHKTAAAASAAKSGKSAAPASSAPAAAVQQGASPTTAGAGKGSSLVQPPASTQTVLLPSGIGQSAFACFVKDRKQSRFGQFLNMLLPPAAMTQPFAPLLTMPAIGLGALSAVRSIVGMIATHPGGDQSGDQLTVFQQAPREIAATRECPLAADKRALRIRTGIYLLAPKREVAQLKNPADYKVLDGWLVPRQTLAQEALDASRDTLRNMSYLTMEVKVERTNAGCSAPAKKA